MVKRETSVENMVRMGRLKNVGAWGRVALEVKEKGGIKIVPLAESGDAENFNIGDLLVFEYDDRGYATTLRKPTKGNLPKVWQERS